MNIGVVDADLIFRTNHRFPNLACMKISSYHKSIGDNVSLVLNYRSLNDFDKIYISKVFSDTNMPNEILKNDRVEYGGTGFFYDKAVALPDCIEHSKPDYDLYKDFANGKMESGMKRKDFEYYLDYSIGFTTRGCFRKCDFCVNKKYDRVEVHSPLSEFFEKSKKYICLLDDNVFGYPKWKEIFLELNSAQKPFQFKQGLDIRLLNDEKAKILANSKYKDHPYFAFDSIRDRETIESKLAIWKKYNPQKQAMLYVLCGFESQDKYDIINLFERIKILMSYGCCPYVMRYKDYKNSEYYGMYVAIAGWCNQFNLYKKMSFREYCEGRQKYTPHADGGWSSQYKYMMDFEALHPEIAKEYFDMKFMDLNKYAIKS